MGLACAFLLGGYEFVRSTINTLFKAAIGTRYLPAVMVATPPAILAGLFLYGRALTAFGPKLALRITSLASGAGFLGGFLLWRLGLHWIAFPLYVLREIYVVLIIEQYWSFMVSFLSAPEAKRMNGPFCGIASVGSVAGAFLLSRSTLAWGTAPMLIAGTLSLVPATLLVEWIYRQAGEPAAITPPTPPTGSPPVSSAPPTDHLGLSLFRTYPGLIVLFVLILLTQGIGTFHEMTFQIALQEELPDLDAQNAYSGRFFGWLNLLAALGQFLAAPVLLSLLPLAMIHILIPLSQMLLCLLIWLHPCLTSFAIPYLVFKVLDYSLFRSAKEIFYIPLPFDARYRAKEVIDVLGYRLGKAGSALLILGIQALGVVLLPGHLALSALIGFSFWLLLLLLSGKELHTPQ
jgi:AAA family ATP:ADP antiporter